MAAGLNIERLRCVSHNSHAFKSLELLSKGLVHDLSSVVLIISSWGRPNGPAARG